MSLKVYVYLGTPGSGKSFDAKRIIDRNFNQYKRINKDDLRQCLDNSNWSRDSEKFIIKVRDLIILEALANGKHVLVDDCNFGKHVEHITQLVKGKAEVIIKDFTDVPVEVCIERDLKRLNSVGEKVIRGMYNKYVRQPIPVIEYNSKLEDIYIVDLDGSISLLNGRNPYDASTANNDLLNIPLYNLIKDKKIIFVSGREDKYRSQTVEFLTKHKLNYLFLFMRPTGNNNKDYKIKKEIYDNHIRDKYNVLGVFDDRLQVKRLWYELGLPLFGLGDPDADF